MFEASVASVASGASVRWRKAPRRRALRNSPPPPHDPLHYFTVANEEDACRGAQMEEERRGSVRVVEVDCSFA